MRNEQMATNRNAMGTQLTRERDALHNMKPEDYCDGIPYNYTPENKLGLIIPKEFLDKFPKLPMHKAQEKWDRYLQVMRKALLRRVPFMNDDKTTISTKKLRDDCGRFYPYGKNNDRYTKEETAYVYNELYPLYPFFATIKKGNNISHKNSDIVIVNQKLIDLLIDTADHDELVSLYYGDMTEDELDELFWVPIDLQSLDNYIKATSKQLPTIDVYSKPAYYYKILKSLRQAKYIKIITEFFDQDQFPMRVNKSPYGRTYYTGLNLQNCHKEVRNAALGDNHQYDLEAAVYAIKMMLIDDIYTEQGKDLDGHYIYTKEYLDHKGHIRNKLAMHIQHYQDPVKLVKETITAIGFGAKISGGAWGTGLDKQYPAINSIIMNDDDRTRFLNDAWVINFQKEQVQLTKEITNYYKNKKGWCDTHMANLPRSTNKIGKYRTTAIMSYLFQKLETMIMEDISKDLDKDDILLTVHDSIICKYPLNGIDLQDIRSKLLEHSPFLKISKEFNKGWLDIDTMSYEVEHKEFIKQQERLANGYKSEYAQTDNIPVVKHKHEKVETIHDGKCYDSYDEGRKHESYDVDNDELLNDMTLDQRREHFRILGHEINRFPDSINKLINKSGKQSF